MSTKPISAFSPGRTIFGAIAATIAVGTALLLLFGTRTASISLIDVIFTATSATCVTGLFTVPLDQFTTTGHAIVLALIQIGGMMLIIMSLVLSSLFLNLGLRTKLMAGKILELESWHNLRTILAFTLIVTLTLELIGTVCIIPLLAAMNITPHTWFHALFYAISSFCNAGISPLPNPIAPLANSITLQSICAILIFAGGLGFVTWYELWQAFTARLKRTPFRFSLHSKIVLYGSSALLAVSAIIIWIIERERMFASYSGLAVPLSALFHAVSFKSTGFVIVPLQLLQPPTIFLAMILTFIGSAPGSTGSGIKITTFVVFVAAVKAALMGKTSVELRGRQLAPDQILKANSIVAISIGWIMLTTFCLLVTDSHLSPFGLLFETVSALTNLGMTTGLTPSLSTAGKILIIISMIIGRVGSFTLVLGLLKKQRGGGRIFLPTRTSHVRLI